MPNFQLPTDIQALIFDCDGTLANTLPGHYRSWIDAFASEGATFFDEPIFYQEFAGCTSEETVLAANKQYGYQLDPKALAQHKDQLFVERYSDFIEPIEPIIAIAKAHVGKLPMAVASGGALRAVDLTLAQLNIKPLFSHTVTCEDVAKGKPAPDLFLLTAKK